MAPSRVVAGGIAQSSASSGVFFQGQGNSHVGINSHLSPFCNSINSIPETGCSTLGPVSGDANNIVLNGVASSGSSVGASSLVTDANSALSGGPYLQRSASINTESYNRLPASPMSFSSNNLSLSGSSVIDGSSLVQQGSQQDQNSQAHQGQQQHGASSATSLLISQTDQVSLAEAVRLSNPFIPESNNLSQVQKKQRLDSKQEDILKQQVMQQFMQRQVPLQLQGQNPHLQALLQEQRLRQQQILQSMPQMQRTQLQRQQLPLRHPMQQLGMQQPLSALKRPSDSGVCSRRLMQYLYHQRQRPPENTIAYWRKFVKEYYSPCAKIRWCLSLYDNVGQHALGVFPQATMDAWQCDICGSKSGRGFEATFEVLPRLNDIKFGSGVIDELLFLDSPHESRFPSGIMMLEYEKAVQESVYAQLRVVREGHLRIIFSQDLKILSWEFCARRHEELLLRKIVAPHVNQMLQAAQKCQCTISGSGSDGVSEEDLQTNSSMVLTAGRLLARSLELQSLNDLGFSKRYVRCLQISEVVNSMKDLIDFCADQKVGPIEGLKNYPRLACAAKFQMQKVQEVEQLANASGLPTERNTLNKLMAMNPGLNSLTQSMLNRGSALNRSAQAALALSNYQNLIRQQNSTFRGTTSSDSLPTSSGISNMQLPPQQPNQRLPNAVNIHRENVTHPSQQHHIIQQILQEVASNGGGASSKVLGNVAGPTPSRSNSFKDSSAAVGNNESIQKDTDFTQSFHLPENMVQDIANEYSDNGFFSSDFDDNLGYDWKA